MEKNVESSEATFGILMDVMGAPGSGEIRESHGFCGGKLWFMEQPSGKLMGRGPFGTCFSMFSSDDMIFFRFPKDLKR